MRFANKSCLVTGAGSGIGKAIALRFAREGGKVAVVDRNQQQGRDTVREITSMQREALFVPCDVGNRDDVKAAVHAVVEAWRHVDVVINDAAMMTFKPILELPDEEWDTVLNVNLRSVFLFCKYSVPHMRAG